jgi:hypothetical protein
VVFQNGFFVGGDGGTILTSPDGVSWSLSAPTSFSNRGLGTGSGMIAVGNFQSEGRLHHSNNGLGWPGNSISFPEILNGVVYGYGNNPSWVAVGNGGLIVQGGHRGIRLSEPRFANGAFEMTIKTEPSLSSYQVQATTNLTDWATVQIVPAPPQTYVFRDATANTLSRRFYRVVSP